MTIASIGCAAALTSCSSFGGSSGAASDASSGIGVASASTSPSPGPTPVDPREALPAASAKGVGEVAYSAASAAVRERLAGVAEAAEGVSVASGLNTLSIGGKKVGGIAAVVVPAEMAGSDTFQDQFVVQLLNGVTDGARAPRFVRVDGVPVATTDGKVRYVGWFDENTAYVVAREASSPDLVSLAAAVMDAPPPQP